VLTAQDTAQSVNGQSQVHNERKHGGGGWTKAVQGESSGRPRSQKS
jgi:hypothetical protein